MNIKVDHPPVPNIYQSAIGDLQKLAESQSKLRSYMLAQKISRQQNLGNLEDIYKPILSNQVKQINETKVTNSKLDESNAELTNILQQLVVNGDLTNAASQVIVNKLDKLDKGVLNKRLNTVNKKPETIALIQTLSKYPKVVNAIKTGDIAELNNAEIKVFNELNKLDDRTLDILVDYYSNVEPDSGSLFDTRPSSRASQALDEEDVATKIGNTYSDSGIGTASNITSVTGAEGGVNDAASFRENAIRQQAAFKEKSNLVYSLVNYETTKKSEQAILKYINDDYKYEYVDRNNVTVEKEVSGTKLLINYLITHNINPGKRSYPWRIINSNTNVFDELDVARRHAAPSGTGVKFLSSNPKILLTRLNILLAEKKAGNNNVFDEISATSDELRRNGVLSLRQIKNLYKKL